MYFPHWKYVVHFFILVFGLKQSEQTDVFHNVLCVRSASRPGFDLAWFSSLSSECLCIFGFHGAIYSLNIFVTSRLSTI